MRQRRLEALKCVQIGIHVKIYDLVVEMTLSWAMLKGKKSMTLCPCRHWLQ
jgi:hypothetical protein